MTNHAVCHAADAEMGQGTKALRASLWRAGNVGWLIAWE